MGDVDIWDLEFGELDVDIDLIQEFSARHRGSVRISMGLFCTKNEFEKEKKRVLSHPIP
ncbi:MAG: hypothetical protein U9N61_08270 [Euryarchaeota archaeon]|nr:hypothetical protein [Euryarchaeota archaeon]